MSELPKTTGARSILAISILLLFGCTKTIDEGQYGPFTIGESKESALAKIEEMGVRPEPVPYPLIYIEDPSRNDLSQLNYQNGILVWVDKHPFPLRIVLKEDRVLSTWGASDECRASVEKMNIACEEIRRLNRSIMHGMSRDDVYDLLIGFASPLAMQVGNFVVGEQEFRSGKNQSKDEYRILLLGNNAWSFRGLQDLLWLPHFYSKVTLFFENEELERIEHWRFLIELP